VPTKTKAAPKAVHRSLHLTSPLAKGLDVRALQSSVKKGLAHYEVGWLPLAIDGDRKNGGLGRQTIHAAGFYAWILGAPNSTRRKIKNGTLTQAVQKVLRNPEQRGRAWRTRARLRKNRLAKIRKAQDEGAKAAVAYAKSMLGVTENPAGSNSGPTITRDGKKGGVSFWEAAFGLGACYWCGCFAGYVAKFIGGAKLTGTLTYGPDIIADAQAHRNGLVAVSAADSRAGDIPVYWGGEHIGFCVGPPREGCLHTIEGNTSSDSGSSQSNGGGVFEKHRPFSDATVIARPLYG
jgi:hypothetical protein